MREILFRGKQIDNGEWVEGYLYKTYDGKYEISNYNADLNIERYTSNVIPETIGQYTGLNDRDGNRIFEGDILQYGDKKLVVWWNDESFQWQAKEKQEGLCTFDGHRTVGVWNNIDMGWIAAEIPCVGKMTTYIIGNIYDNPELLK